MSSAVSLLTFVYQYLLARYITFHRPLIIIYTAFSDLVQSNISLFFQFSNSSICNPSDLQFFPFSIYFVLLLLFHYLMYFIPTMYGIKVSLCCYSNHVIILLYDDNVVFNNFYSFNHNIYCFIFISSESFIYRFLEVSIRRRYSIMIYFIFFL